MTETDRAFKWLEDHGYPTAAMSQLEGYATFYLAPILTEFLASHAPSAHVDEVAMSLPTFGKLYTAAQKPSEVAAQTHTPNEQDLICPKCGQESTFAFWTASVEIEHNDH